MKSIRAGIAVILTLIFATAALGQPGAATEQILEEIAGKTKIITSYRVDMKMKTSMMGQSMTTTGEMAYKMPNKMHMKTSSDMMGGMSQEIFAANDVVWTYMPMMKMATKMDLSKIKEEGSEFPGRADQADITKLLEGFPKDMIKYIETKKVDGGEVYVFEVTPDFAGAAPPGRQPPPMLPDKMIFHLYTDTGLPLRMTTLAKDGSTMMEQTYSNYRINIEIDDSEFEFKPPEGVQVMDMTEGAINMMKEMQGSRPNDQ